MAEDKTNVGLIGFGTIGSGVVKLIESKPGLGINIKRIVDLNVSKIKKNKDIHAEKYIITEDAHDIINDKDINIVIELIGGYEPAREFILKAIKNKKNVVTANKAVISEHGPEIFKAAKKHKVNIGFEASSGGGMQIISTIKKKLETNKISKIIGILNGTTNYILTRMFESLDSDEPLSYDEALKEAQEKGFAEADPDFDVSGKDATQKLSILSSIIFNQYISPKEIYCEGITKITDVDIDSAHNLGYVIKLLAIAKKEGKKLELRVHPTLISKEHPLSKILYETNAIYLEGDLFKEELYTGKGAGQDPTASAVVYDVLDIARKIKDNHVEKINFYENPKDEIIKIDDIQTKGYLRLVSKHIPGVFGKEATVLGKYKININEMTQRKKFKITKGDEVYIPDIIIIEKTDYKTINNVLKDLKKLDCLKEEPFYLRILD